LPVNSGALNERCLKYVMITRLCGRTWKNRVLVILCYKVL